MNKLEITSIYCEGLGSALSNCELDYNISAVKEILGRKLPSLNMHYVIGQIKEEKGTFYSFRGKGFGSYDTKAEYSVDLDIIKNTLDKENLKKQCVQELEKINKTSELLDIVGLKQKLIKAALGTLKLKDIVGKYLYKDTLEVAEVTYEDLGEGIENYGLDIDYFTEDNYTDNWSLFDENDRLEYKFELLKCFGVISDEEYKKYTGKELHHDPNENKKGYFQCWECGTWQPISKRQDDGTCGC